LFGSIFKGNHISDLRTDYLLWPVGLYHRGTWCSKTSLPKKWRDSKEIYFGVLPYNSSLKC